MIRHRSVWFLLLACIMISGLIPSHASWYQDGIRICTRSVPKPYNPQSIPDGNGGTIVTWDDERTGEKDIYAQLADSSGAVQWTLNGASVCMGADEQSYPQLASDGCGGAIIVWRDYRNGNYDIYAQRLDAAGAAQWAADGIAICTATEIQDSYQIMPDGAGGAIVVWRDYRGSDADIYAQRINAAGVIQWTADGVAICTAAGDQEKPRLTTDGASGTIVCWRDERSSAKTYIQRIDQDGVARWPANGVPCTGSGTTPQDYPQIIYDGAGGAILTWMDNRSGNYDIYAQRVDDSGTLMWGSDGLAVCVTTGYQASPQLTPDGAGGAIIAWQDGRDGNYDIYAQRTDASGTIQWTVNGIGVCTVATGQKPPQITTDGAGGAIIAWVGGSTDDNIYTQRVDASGSVQWATDGVPVCINSLDKDDPGIISDDSGGAIVVWWQRTAVHAQRIDGSGGILWEDFNGNAICTCGAGQLFPSIVSDGSGGAIVAWADHCAGYTDVYAQRVNGSGTLQWASDGVSLCNVPEEDRYPPEITSDGAGGAIIAWNDDRWDSDDIYAQRVDASGVLQWPVEGVAICTAWGGQYFHKLDSDDAGGAIITWIDIRNDGFYGDIYAQRVDASGAVKWAVNGVAVCTAAYDQMDPQIVPDGSGGAIITWYDDRSGSYYSDIYAQRLDASGAVKWAVNGVAVCTEAYDQLFPQIVSDGIGGAIITWDDIRSGDSDIYAQRVDASGAVQWTANGVAVCTAPGSQMQHSTAPDGFGGAIIAWLDERSGNYDIYAQRIDSSGAVQWIENGLPIRTAPNNQQPPLIIKDGEGGAIITWIEYLVKDSDEDYDIYAQRISAMGALYWQIEGIPVCTVEGFQTSPTLCSDDAGGAIITWRDDRSDTAFVYAGRLDSTGNQPPATCYELPVPEVLQPDSSYWSWAACSRAVLLHSGIDADLCDIADFARDNNGWGEGECCPFDPESACNRSNELYGTAGSVQAILENWGVSSSGVSSPLSFEDLRDSILAGSPVFVMWDDGNDANGEPHIVLAHSVCQQNIYIMDPSNDNDPGIVSGWMHYDCLAAGLGHEPWTASLVADHAPTEAETVLPLATSLAQNYPNPFNPTTAIPFMLKRPSNVSLRVYDVSGKLVRTIFTGRLGAGRHEKKWDGTDDTGNEAASGVYFYRLKAGSFEDTRKMVLVR